MDVQAITISPDNFPPAKFSTLSMLLNQILPLLTAGAALIFLVMFFSAAFNIITAGDSPEKIKKAKYTITFAIVGLIVVVTSFLIVKLIARILNIGEGVIPL